MPLQKLPVHGLDDVNHARRVRESINKVLDHSFNDEKAQTSNETVTGITPDNMAYSPIPADVRRYKADPTGAVDSTSFIQRSIDAANTGSVQGTAITLPGDANSVYEISASINVPKRPSGDNHTRWYQISGMGRGAPRIKAISGMTDQPMLSLSGIDATTICYYREVKNLYLQGAGIAQRGIELYYNQHFKVENVFINGLVNGSGTASGVRVYGAICSQFRDIKVHNTQGHGIHAPDGSGNFFNANLIEGCSFLDLTGSGIYITGGMSGSAIVGNTAEFCDEYGIRLDGYSGTGGFIGGNYFESNGLGDVYIGVQTTANNVLLEGNYCNGYDNTVSDASYTPIKIRFADGVMVRGNMVNLTTKSTTGYLILDANISGGSVINCTIENNQVRSLALSTAPNTIYNIPGRWCYDNNKLIDQNFVPFIPSNLLGGERLPYSWSGTVSGTGTYVRGAVFMGAPSAKLDRPAASTCSMSRTYTLTPEQKNRFLTFAIPVRDISGSGQLSVTVTPNGTSPQVASITGNTLAAGKEEILYGTCFAPSDATTIALAITLNNTSTYEIGHPCLYVGAQPWYSSAGYSDWTNPVASAPTNGTWVQGDRVWRTDATSGAAMGFVCTVGGSPGTWKAMANLA